MKGSIWINVLVGIWLIIAPFAMPAGAAMTARAVNDVVLGILLIGFSWYVLAATLPATGAAYLEIVCGAWLIIAPFVLRYSGAAAAVWNDVVCGIIALVVAAIAAQATTRTPRTTV